MNTNRKGRIRIGTEMPGWLPARLHMPARLVMGLVLGGLFAGYAVLLAITVGGILDGGPWAFTQGALRLSGLLVGALLIRRFAIWQATRR